MKCFLNEFIQPIQRVYPKSIRSLIKIYYRELQSQSISASNETVWMADTERKLHEMESKKTKYHLL